MALRAVAADATVGAVGARYPEAVARTSRFGYRRVHAILPRQGLSSALRTVQRLRRRAGLQIVGPAVRPKTPPRPDAKIKSDGVNDAWCVDVVFDITQHGATVKFLTLLDEYSHFTTTSWRAPAGWAAARSWRPSRRLRRGMGRHAICAVTMAASLSPSSSERG